MIFFDFFFFFRKIFLRKLFSQNVFWIDYGSGKHKKKFLELKEGEKGKNFDKKVNSLTRYKIGGSRRRRRTFFQFQAPLGLRLRFAQKILEI